MTDEKDDIARYRNGSMTAAERHALEKKALGDPFLADALDGSATVSSKEFTADLQELSRKIKDQSTKVWYTPLRIAAGIVLLIGVGATFYFLNSSPSTQLALEKNASSTVPTDSLLPPVDSSSSLLTLAKPMEPVVGIRKSADQSSPEQTKADQAGNAKSATGPIAEIPETQSQPAAVSVQAEEESKINSVALSDDRKEAVELTPSLASGASGLNKKAEQSVRASKMKDLSPAESSNKNLPTAVDMKLEGDTPLTEVVVTGKAFKTDRGNEPVVRTAIPAGGLEAYRQYLINNLNYPAEAAAKKVKGEVLIQFRITATGSLTAFSVLKGLGYGCDEEVIRLVKLGPQWSPSTQDDVPIESEVKVRMLFDPEKAKH